MYYIINNNKNIDIEFNIGVLLEKEDILIELINNSVRYTPKETVSDINVNKKLTELGIKFLEFNSRSHFKKKYYDMMEKLALYDGDVNFNELLGKVDEKFIDRLNYLQRSMNYNQMYLNRIVDMDTGIVHVGCVIHSVGNIIGGRVDMNYTKYLDEYPFILAKRIINYLEDLDKPCKIDKIVFGYDFNLNRFEENIRTAIATPNKNIVELENMQIINQYILNGTKLLPIQEVLDG